MRSWKNPITIEDIRAAETAGSGERMQHIANVQEWLANLNTTGIDIPPDEGMEGITQQRSTIEPKLIRKHAEWRYGSLSEPFHTADTLFKVSPVSAEDQPITEQDQAVLAHQMRHYVDKVKLIDDTIRTGVDEGTVLMQVGWEYLEKIHKSVEVDEFGNTREVEEVEVITNNPTFQIHDFDAAIMDPNAEGDLSKAQYLIIRRSDTIASLREDGSYSNLDDIGHTKGSGDVFNASIPADGFLDEERNNIDVMTYWGYWDKDGEGTLEPVMVTYVGDVIIKQIDNPFPDEELPFVLIPYLPVRGSNYGQPDGVLLSDSQKITGALVRGTMDLMGKSAVGQKGYAETALDPVNKLRFMRGDNYAFRDDVDPSKIHYQHTYPEIPNSALTMMQMQQQEAESLTGVMTMGEGVSTGSLGTGSAAAARGVLNSATKRESGILRRFASGFEHAARKIIAMNHAFLSAEEVEAITGAPYVEPKRGKYLIDVTVTIRTAEADMASANDLETLTQTVGNSIDPGLTQVIIGKIMRLKGLPDLAAQVEQYEPTPDPLAVRQQELEIELLEAKLENEMAMSNERNTQAGYNEARSATEVERTRKLGAEADKIDLEFVEQETGTTHERDKDLLNTQAEGNMQLKLVEADARKNEKTPPTNSSK